jgi:hypothetical protein
MALEPGERLVALRPLPVGVVAIEDIVAGGVDVLGQLRQLEQAGMALRPFLVDRDRCLVDLPHGVVEIEAAADRQRDDGREHVIEQMPLRPALAGLGPQHR